MTNDEMTKTIEEVGRRLQESYNDKSIFRFPKYRERNASEGRTKRVSEQEARILFSHVFMCKGIPFSVEVPTRTVHKQSGSKYISARYDMAVYKDAEYDDLEWVIELKSHNCTQESIQKDIEKMAMSNHDCIWFHVVKNENRETCRTILRKFTDAMDCEKEKHKGYNQWILAFIILDKAKLYLTTMHLHDDRYDPLPPIDSFEVKSTNKADAC